MEDQLASLTLQDNKTNLTSLPPELITDIAVLLPLGSLAAFSLISRAVRNVVQPLLYRRLELRCDGPVEQQQRRCDAACAAISLLGDEERCQMIRELDMREWSPMDGDSYRTVARVLTMSTNLQAVQLAAERWFPPDFGSGNTLCYCIWPVILSLPSLRSLSCVGGPPIPLNLDQCSNLRRLSLASLDLQDQHWAYDTLPPLTHLTLDAVRGFTTRWFSPKLFESLGSLTLVRCSPKSAKVITESLQIFVKSGAPSTAPLHSLALDPRSPAPMASDHSLALMEILTAAASFPRLVNVEVRSAAFGSKSLEVDGNLLLAPLLSGLFEILWRAHRFVFCFCPSDPDLNRPTLQRELATLLPMLPYLKYFGTDLTSFAAPRTAPILLSNTSIGNALEDAERYFGTHRTLQEVVIPAPSFGSEQPLAVFRKVGGQIVEAERAEHWQTKSSNMLWE